MFTRKRICTLATAQGRITLDDARLITTTNGRREELDVNDEASFHRLLVERFGVRL
jgi:N-hydroxyarylamine O-acetyltransferase